MAQVVRRRLKSRADQTSHILPTTRHHSNLEVWSQPQSLGDGLVHSSQFSAAESRRWTRSLVTIFDCQTLWYWLDSGYRVEIWNVIKIKIMEQRTRPESWKIKRLNWKLKTMDSWISLQHLVQCPAVTISSRVIIFVTRVVPFGNLIRRVVGCGSIFNANDSLPQTYLRWNEIIFLQHLRWSTAGSVSSPSGLSRNRTTPVSSL